LYQKNSHFVREIFRFSKKFTIIFASRGSGAGKERARERECCREKTKENGALIKRPVVLD